MEQLPNDYLSSEGELQINHETSGYLIETSKWAKFITIMFYVLFGVAILLVLAYGSYFFHAGSYRSRAVEETLTIAVVSLIVGAIVVAVTYYFLISFANKIRAGLESENIEQVNAGLGALKTHFIIIGILLVLGILFQLYTLSNKF